jgi:hypothetical protein
MEAQAVKKGIIYTVAAAILGLSLVLIPLITIRAESEYNGFLLEAVPARLQRLEGRTYETNVANSWSTEIQFLAIVFVLALIEYLLFRRKSPYRYRARTLQYPY